MNPTLHGRWIAGSVFVAAFAASRVSFAQLDAGSEASRRELIRQAQQAANSGDHARALEMAQRAGQLRMSPPLRRLIAEQQFAAGSLAEAMLSAELCAREAQADTTLRDASQHVAACQALLANVRTRVGRVVVRIVQPAPEGLRVTVSGHDLPSALWGIPYIVSPGTALVEANAPGFAPFRQSVQVAGGGTVELPLTLARAEPASVAPVNVTPAIASSSSPPPEAECRGGMIASASTANHCCWPGQTWSLTRTACDGTPSCPPGLSVRGTECAPATVAAGASPAPAVTVALPSASPPPSRREDNRATAASSPLRTIGYVGLAGTVVLGAVGVGGSLWALDIEGRFNGPGSTCYVLQGRAQSVDPARLAECQNLAGAYDSASALMIAGYVAGGVFLAGSIVALVVAPRPRAEVPRTMGLVCTPRLDGIGVACGGRF